MIITLPISEEIEEHGYAEIEDIIDAVEYKNFGYHRFGGWKKKIFHSSEALLDRKFKLKKDQIDILEHSGIKLYSCSFAPSCEDFSIVNNKYQAKSRILRKEQIKEKAKEKIKDIRNKLGKNIEFAFENTNDLKTSAYWPVTDPFFISEVVRENDVGFVLDLAHAKISAHHQDMSSFEYVKYLPLEKCVEIHLSRPFIDWSSNELYDAHGLPDNSSYWLLDHALTMMPSPNGIYLVLEYYQFHDLILEEYKKLGREYGKI